jgi:8-oxo-dGTP diphosphatase
MKDAGEGLDSMADREYPDRPFVGVGAVVIREGQVLLVRRGRPPGEGLWAIPGGVVELGETLQAAAEREIKEETGLEVRAGAPVYTFDSIHRDSEGAIRFHYIIVDLTAQYISGEIRAGGDAGEARWVALSEVDALVMSKHMRELLKRVQAGQ